MCAYLDSAGDQRVKKRRGGCCGVSLNSTLRKLSPRMPTKRLNIVRLQSLTQVLVDCNIGLSPTNFPALEESSKSSSFPVNSRSK
jgi:hypothetical protein